MCMCYIFRHPLVVVTNLTEATLSRSFACRVLYNPPHSNSWPYQKTSAAHFAAADLLAACIVHPMLLSRKQTPFPMHSCKECRSTDALSQAASLPHRPSRHSCSA